MSNSELSSGSSSPVLVDLTLSDVDLSPVISPVIDLTFLSSEDEDATLNGEESDDDVVFVGSSVVAQGVEQEVNRFWLSFDPGMVNLGFCAFDPCRREVVALQSISLNIAGSIPSAGQIVESVNATCERIILEFPPSRVFVEGQMPHGGPNASPYNVAPRNNGIVEACIISFFRNVHAGVHVMAIHPSTVSARITFPLGHSLHEARMPTGRQARKRAIMGLLTWWIESGRISPNALAEYRRSNKRDDIADAFSLIYIHL